MNIVTGKQESVYDLIRSMSKAEKRNFKLYATRLSGNQEAKFISLFDCMDALDEYLPWADYVLCCLPRTVQTNHLLDEARLRSMKPDAVLVNAGRGNLIDLDGLCRVLKDGHLWGVGLDVAEKEPLPPEHPIWDCPRLIITPHAAGNSMSMDSPTMKKISEFIVENFRRYVSGQPVLAQADFLSGYCAK